MPSAPLLAIGELLIDLLTTDFVNDLSEASTLRALPGGSPANLCRFVQRCGGQAQLVAAVGQDGFGDLLLRALTDGGLDTTHVSRLPDRATSVVAVGRSRTTPSFIPYRSADRHLPAPSSALIAKAGIVHTTAFALSRQPAQDRILNALRLASAHQRPISCDWNYAAPIWRRHDNARAVWAELLTHRPLLKVSLDDIARFTKCADVTPESARRFLDGELPNPRAVCLTCGPDGVWYRGGEYGWQHQHAAPIAGPIHDVTGAGDAFWAGFLTAWLRAEPLPQCVAAGTHTAARRLQGEI